MAGDELTELAERVAIVTEQVHEAARLLDSIEAKLDALSPEEAARRSA